MKWMKNENKCEIQSRFGKNEKYKKCVYMRINKLWSELHYHLNFGPGGFTVTLKTILYIYIIFQFLTSHFY